MVRERLPEVGLGPLALAPAAPAVLGRGRPDHPQLARVMTALQQRVLPKSGLGQACAYLLGHWAPLTAHLRHSHTRLDTNTVENAIRPSKLGAKNWLFVGHPDAGDRPAVIYSLIVSAQRCGHDPHAYLKDVLARLPALTTKDDLSPLLPTHWTPVIAS